MRLPLPSARKANPAITAVAPARGSHKTSTPVAARVGTGAVVGALAAGAVVGALAGGAVGVTDLELAETPEVPPPLVAVEENV